MTQIGRPRKDPLALRQNKTVRCHPKTWAALKAHARKQKLSVGELVDALAAIHCPPPERGAK